MYDIKHSDEKIHRELTGVGLTTIHVNLREAARRAARGDLRLWIRTPLVPGASAEPSVLDAIGRFLRAELHGAVERWELCAFNPSCGSKYRRLGMEWDYADLGLQTESETASLLTVAGNAIGRTDVVHLQGIRRRFEQKPMNFIRRGANAWIDTPPTFVANRKPERRQKTRRL